MSNNFDTHQVRPWHQTDHQTCSAKRITTASSFAVGLTSFDVGPPRKVRVTSYIKPSTPPSVDFTVHIDTWDDTVLYSASCTWLEVGPTDRDLQCGTWAVAGDHTRDAPQLSTSARITFPYPYAEPPKVIVWLAGLDTDRENVRVHVSTSDIDGMGFTIHANTWAGTFLHDARVSWIAHPADRPNIKSGVFGTKDIRTWETPRNKDKSEISFDQAFKAPPRVYAAFNLLDIGIGTDVCIGLAVQEF